MEHNSEKLNVNKHHRPGNESSNEIEDLGLTLWKLHVNSDEQRIDQQLKFLQTFQTDLSNN